MNTVHRSMRNLPPYRTPLQRLDFLRPAMNEETTTPSYRSLILLERNDSAKTQAWKEQPGGFGARARLHGHDLFLRPGRRQAGDDQPSPFGRRTRRDLLRYG